MSVEKEIRGAIQTYIDSYMREKAYVYMCIDIDYELIYIETPEEPFTKDLFEFTKYVSKIDHEENDIYRLYTQCYVDKGVKSTQQGFYATLAWEVGFHSNTKEQCYNQVKQYYDSLDDPFFYRLYNYYDQNEWNEFVEKFKEYRILLGD